MKRPLLLLCIVFFVMSVSAQQKLEQDTTRVKGKEKEKKIKTGWNFGALPVIAYDTDMGFEYGALVELYQWGKGDIYPDYYHKFYFEASGYTKGSSVLRFNYESAHLIPGVRLSTDLAYLYDGAYDFYGFNGYDAVFNKSWADQDINGGTDYRTRMFYREQRKLFRFKNDFVGKIAGEHFFWNAGFAIQNFDVSSVDIAKFNKGKSSGLLPGVDSVPGLYELYQKWGILSPSEANGGLINTVKLGVAWDSRDNRPNPMKGIWTEAGIETSQKFLGSEATFGKFYFTYRQYFTIVPNDLSFAYRLGYQQTIFGTVPFYYQSQMIVSVLRGDYSEGLGGSKTLRGILRNRIIGDGFCYGNAEFRWKAVRFTFINQNWYIGVNAFTDFGMVTDKIRFTQPTQQQIIDAGYTSTDQFFDPGAEKMHVSAGGGLRVVMNENFVIAIDLGRAFNPQDGGTGLYIGLNYLF
jgi:Omp85 superfamily domain